MSTAIPEARKELQAALFLIDHNAKPCDVRRRVAAALEQMTPEKRSRIILILDQRARVRQCRGRGPMTLELWADISGLPEFVSAGNAIWKAFHGGSRVTVNPKPTDTDDDYVILLKHPLEPFDKELLAQRGFTLGGSDFLHTNETSSFQSYSNGLLNLIFTTQEKWYENMLLATQTCMRLNLWEKADRIVLFQAIVYRSAPCPAS